MTLKHIIGLTLIATSLTTLAKITVTEPWARATVDGQTMGGAFMVLHNSSSTDAQLIAVRSPAAQEAQLHTMNGEGNMMHMAQVTELIVPAGQSIELKPKSTHIMLMGLKHTLHAGDRVPLVLNVMDQGKHRTIRTTADVRALGQ